MRIPFFLFTVLTCVSMQVQANEFFSIKEALQSPEVKTILNPDVKLFWGNQATPELSIKSPANNYERAVSRTPPNNTVEAQCLQAFANTLSAILAEARVREYDAVTDIRSDYDGKPASDESTYECAGYGRRSVRLSAAFALTRAGATLAEKARTDPSVIVPQALKRTAPPRGKSLFLPLAPVLANEKVKAAQAGLVLHVGAETLPGYVVEDAPEDFTRSTGYGSAGYDAACYETAVKIVVRMIESARENNYPAVIRIRSYFNEQPAPNATDFECEPGAFTASVTLIGSFAKVK
jgi:hypothetical protein